MEGPGKIGVGAQNGPTEESGLNCPKAWTRSGQCWEDSWAGVELGWCQAPADSGRGPEALRVVDQRIQDADDLGKARPLGPVLVPTVEHELVQGTGAAHGCRQAVPLLHGADDLGRGNTMPGLRLSLPPRPCTAFA